MANGNRGSIFTLILCAVLALLSGVLLAQTVQAAPLALPPRPSPPTPPPKDAPTPPPKDGGTICLHAYFNAEWPWDSIHWQELWTIVQWQDGQGLWHDVEGWQGTLDSVTVSDKGDVAGKKAWWVAETDLGKGPFRWVVYSGKAGKVLATSAAFDLPSSVGGTVSVEVSLGTP